MINTILLKSEDRLTPVKLHRDNVVFGTEQPPVGIKGRVFFNTESNEMWLDDGKSWSQPRANEDQIKELVQTVLSETPLVDDATITKLVNDQLESIKFEDTPDNKNYLRTQDAWVEFNLVDGSKGVQILNKVLSATEENYVPKVGEFCYIVDKDRLVFGDGKTNASNLSDIRGTSIPYTPENEVNKGQPNGYAPLDSTGKVPTIHLPSNLTDTYSKSEVNTLLDTQRVTLQTNINSEGAERLAIDTLIEGTLKTHIDDKAIHVSTLEKDKWDQKIDRADLIDYQNHIEDNDIHITAIERNLWNRNNSAFIVNSMQELNDIENMSIGDICYVKTSASGVTPITADKYVYYGEDNDGWHKDATTTNIVSIEWGGINNGPTSSVLAIDYASRNSHVHDNILYLKKISEDNKGHLTYNGTPIGAMVVFANTDAELPKVGEENVLYITMRDSRVHNYPSINVWKDGLYELLGRGVNDTPQPVGDMVILQKYLTNVTANTTIQIEVTENEDFAFLPIEVLKAEEGLKNRTLEALKDQDSLYKFDTHLFKFNNYFKIGDKTWPMDLKKIEDAYYFECTTDLSTLANIQEIN